MSVKLRILFMPDAGQGNIDQYKIISPISSIGNDESNYTLYAINVNDKDTNFVLFARRSAESYNRYTNDTGPIPFTTDDVYRIADFMYGTIIMKYYSIIRSPRLRIDLDLDMSLCPDILNSIEALPLSNPSTAGEYSDQPMTKLYFDTMREHSRRYREAVDVNINVSDFSPEECKKYFFPKCDQCNTPNCCKMRHCQSPIPQQSNISHSCSYGTDIPNIITTTGDINQAKEGRNER